MRSPISVDLSEIHRRRLLAVLVVGGVMVFQGLATDVTFAADADGDLIDDAIDVCLTVADPFQGDVDGDGVGDLCEDTTGVTNIEGTPEGELIVGTGEADTLSGVGGDDSIYGLDGDDTLDGGDGRDFVSGGVGADTLTGGAGCDVFAFDPSGDNDVITDFDVEVDRMAFPGSGAFETPTPEFGGDENLVVTFVADDETAGSLEFEGLPAGIEIALLTSPCFTPDTAERPKEDVIPPEAPSVCAPLFPGAEVEFLFGIEIPLDGVQIDGTSAAETLSGTDCSDAIGGDARFHFFDEEAPEPPCPAGVCSDDIISGLDGNDLLVGDKSYLEIGEIGGDDIINGGNGDDAIIGDAVSIGDCGCGGAGGGDTGGGNDRLNGGDGNDVIFGDAIEAIVGDASGGDDLIDGGNGNDALIGDAFGIVEGAQAGADVLDGGAGDDVIFGDAIFGIDDLSFAGEDSITGGAGDDLLFGDAPAVDGDAASDTFWYDASTNFGDDEIGDLGTREVYDTITFVSNGTGLTDLASLDARSTVADDSLDDLLTTVFTDNTKTIKVGSILIAGAGGAGITSWADLDSMWPVDIVIVP